MTAVFEGKVAIVTGAGRGIGRADCLLFGRLGAKVVVNDLPGMGGEPPVADAVVAEIRAAGGEAIAYNASVASMAGCKGLIEAAMDNYGRIDFLINNAGRTSWNTIDKMSEADFDDVINVNFKSAFAATHYASHHMMKARSGVIVFMDSPSAWGHIGMSSYAGAKEAVAGFARCVARDLAQWKVRCHVVRPMAWPSAMGTPAVMSSLEHTEKLLRTPTVSHRVLDAGGVATDPDNVAAVIGWLCTPQAEPLNAREVFIGGGHVALIQEAELVRSRFNAEGWSFEAMCSEPVTYSLTHGITNPLANAVEA